ncbi:hypothetical protein QBC38DRAFT_471117 [Podospora fimiseda]|uniref:Uncharacterized protein n=1 Tax=Podospora fimiseda TaxID=252190 RepID=A0AAN7H3C1_9PEZI|nr:hypothetical protein QBC38DRAFT_471117 [Podospora fimiseda]
MCSIHINRIVLFALFFRLNTFIYVNLRWKRNKIALCLSQGVIIFIFGSRVK